MAGTVVPGIMNDFSQMVRDKSGETVQEEYRLEDGGGVVILTGKMLKGTISYETVQVSNF